MSVHSRASTTGLLLILWASLCFGFSGPLAKTIINAGVGPVPVTWLRVVGSGIALALVALPVLLRRPKLPWAGLVAFGLAAVAGVQVFYFLAVSRLPVGIALLLEFTGPILVVAWIRFVRRTRLPRSAVIGTLVSLAGLAVVVEVWSGLRLDALGLLAGAAAALCQAVYFLGGEKLTESVDTRVLLASGFLIGGAGLTPFARPWDVDWSLLGTQVSLGGVHVSAALVAVALVGSTVLAYLAGIAGLKLLSAAVAGGMAYLEVVVATLAAWLLLGESLTTAQIIGGLVVLGGVFIAQRAVGARQEVDLAVLEKA
ncbi:EamA family transporter [Phytomonospora endophytica]|uniref:Drug/metabolite transporter (DMT)-like permease n=1 Tax=Phytomonospora endophytica TaxID=714109 RepID=A0A841FLK6_9ACTN|nr:EamA family transporter [Phytomonospora endophytica]MBB6035803.1 drug/metabolite transporter (DMT)-like permease [Phytomonospora endophytica]GIG69526.1 membrane protein [Phytomonospora endophytica]